MKMDQIAYLCNGLEAEVKLKQTFGLDHADAWVADRVFSENKIFPKGEVPYTISAVALLQFNYALGVELEILRYIEGASWHNHLPEEILTSSQHLPVISHIGIHLDDDEDLPSASDQEKLGWRLVQFTKTIIHSNPYVVKRNRKYQYQIFETVPGTYIKYIKRIEG